MSEISEPSIRDSFKVNWWPPDRPVEGNTIFRRPAAFRVDFFAPDRPTGGTVFERPVEADAEEADE